ncbi:hypothetical protein TNCV_561181 [Trichonephila clavipes]|uniref:Uncharacterized protein n=1 Tax=Trichonephila clavipes TaxID=2585209 RepID=A0A8X6SAL2_TRICX|nr:hypothetical protein TNCV_561181 [Trichonephila clavipes]
MNSSLSGPLTDFSGSLGTRPKRPVDKPALLPFDKRFLVLTAFRWRKVEVRINIRGSPNDRIPSLGVLTTCLACIVQDQSLVRLPNRLRLKDVIAVS